MAKPIQTCRTCLRQVCHCPRPGAVRQPQQPPSPTPTFSMQPVRYDNGSWGVAVQLTGLTSKQQAQAAMQHMERLFCGAEIQAH